MLEQLRGRFDSWRLYHRTVRELTVLDTRILRDMGFERTTLRDIKARARTATKEALL